MGVMGEGKKRGQRKPLIEEAWNGAQMFLTGSGIHRTSQAER